MEDLEVVTRSTTGILLPEEGLGTEKAVREVRMNEDIFMERNNVTSIVQSFPSCTSHILDREATSNAS
jgi:hypothetical protein